MLEFQVTMVTIMHSGFVLKMLEETEKDTFTKDELSAWFINASNKATIKLLSELSKGKEDLSNTKSTCKGEDISRQAEDLIKQGKIDEGLDLLYK